MPVRCAHWTVLLLITGCVPKEVTVPKLPEVSRASRQRTAVRCEGEAERLDCAASTTIATEGHGRFEAEERWLSEPEGWELSAEAPVARHRAMAAAWGHRSCRFEEDGCLHRFRVPLVPIRQRAGGFSAAVELAGLEGFSVGRTERREHVDVSLRSESAMVSPGGPLGMVAWRVGGESVVGRVGWEAFAPTFLGHGVTLEGETDGGLRLAYVAQLTTPSVLGLPSLGIGVGLPVVVAPRLTSGLRLQGTLAFPYVGLVAWMDLMDDEDAAVRGYLGGQLSL